MENNRPFHAMVQTDIVVTVYSFRDANWVSAHNGRGVGWGEVINGGFGMLLDGSAEADRRLQSMLFYDVNNGISRRAWARNDEALFAIKREIKGLLG